MSRRSKVQGPEIHHDYAAMRFVCPDGHELAPTAILSDGMAHLYGVREGTVWLDTETGGKIKMKCPKCESNGQRRDLQASWPRVLHALTQSEADPTTGITSFVVGG